MHALIIFIFRYLLCLGFSQPAVLVIVKVVTLFMRISSKPLPYYNLRYFIHTCLHLKRVSDIPKSNKYRLRYYLIAAV